MKNLFPWILSHKKKVLVLSFIFLVVAVVSYKAKKASSAEVTVEAKKGSILESVYGIGTVTATKSFQLRLGVTSQIKKLFVREGDKVREHDRLVDLDESGIFYAPFDGTITYLPVKVGETVFPQGIILSLVDLDDRYVVVSLEQRGAIRVRQGQEVKINFDSMRDQNFSGLVQSVYSNESNFYVRIKVSSLPPQILPGMTGDVAIFVQEHKDAILVPILAIHEGKITVKKNGKKLESFVETGVVDDQMAEITSGISEGDKIIMPKGLKVD